MGIFVTVYNSRNQLILFEYVLSLQWCNGVQVNCLLNSFKFIFKKYKTGLISGSLVFATTH